MKGVFMSKNDNIDCNVHDCRYCNCECNKCKLNCIKVSHSNKDNTKRSTMCSSYKKKM